MQSEASISINDARLLAFGSQLLLNNQVLKGKKGVLKVIEHLGYIQIDTISVVERSHRHILWTRVPDYREEHLEELIEKDKKVFEYWSHAAAYIPMSHYKFAHYRKNMFTYYNKGWGRWANKNKKVISYIYDRIKTDGPLQSRDFEHPQKRGTWWDWKPSKYALEYLFHTGKLMIKARKNFQKVYDLTERVLPPGTDTTEPTEEEHAEHLVLSAIKQHGVVSKNEIVYQKFYSPHALDKVMKKLLSDEVIIPVRAGNLKTLFYSTEYTINKYLQGIIISAQADSPIHILSPFDNMVIQRKRVKELFDFDYTVECYVPAQKRKYGYFCLPVTCGNKFIGRIDAKAERAAGTLKVINLFTEKSVKKTDMKKLVKPKLGELGRLAGCGKVVF